MNMKNIVFVLLAFQFIQPVFLNLDFGTEFIPYVTIFLLLYCINKLITNLSNKKLKVVSKKHVFSLLIINILFLFVIITSAIYDNFSFASLVIIFSPLICIVSTIGVGQKIKKPTNITFLVCWLIWLIVMLIQYGAPNIYDSFSSLFFRRNNYELAERGLSGLSTEPSFAADILLLFYSIWRLKYTSFSNFISIVFLVTFSIVVILNGSVTMYGLMFITLMIEIMVKIINSYLLRYNYNLKMNFNFLKNKVILASFSILLIIVILAIFLGYNVPYRISTFLQPESKISISSSKEISSIESFVYVVTFEKSGSWRTVANYVGYHIGFSNFPFGGGLGSGSAMFPEVISRLFGDFSQTIGLWIVTSFTYSPFVIADLGFIFFIIVIWYVIKITNLRLLLYYLPLEASIIITGLLCILIISPKGSLSPWFMIIYSASHNILKPGYPDTLIAIESE